MMSRFLQQLFLFGCIIVGLLSALGYAVDRGLQKSDLGNFSEWNDIRNGTINADLLVAGSSRAWVHISPLILDSVLQLNSYNLGLDGYPFLAQYMRHEYYLKFNRKPKYIVHSLDNTTLTHRRDLYMLDQFSPYLNDTIIANGTKRHYGFSPIDYYNPFTKYQYDYRYIAIGLLEFFNLKHFPSNKYKGYEGMEKNWDERFDKLKSKHKEGLGIILDKKSIELFDFYLGECKRRGIQTILIYSPEYIEAQRFIKNRQEILKLYQDLSRKYDIPFLDYSNHKICFQKRYFYNSQHMNKNGAIIFSKKLASDLKSYLSASPAVNALPI